MVHVCFSENLAHLGTHHIVLIDTFIEEEPYVFKLYNLIFHVLPEKCKGPKDTIPPSIWLLLASGFLYPTILIDV